MLKYMKDNRIFSVEYDQEKGGFLFQEMCDEYYWVLLSKADLRRVSAELLQLADDPKIPDHEFPPRCVW